MKRQINKDPRIITKWKPIIENNFNYKNSQIIDYVCFFCEWYSSYDPKGDLPKELLNIKSKVDSYNRYKIVGKFYNPASGLIEYKLDNGEYIPLKGSKSSKLSNENLIEIFGVDFIRDIDPLTFRDNQLNKLI